MQRTADAIKSLGTHPEVLARFGLSANEFNSALPAAIESVRGSMSASNSQRREFLKDLLSHLVERGLVSSVSEPTYGEDTIYRLVVPDVGDVAIIQKGCPDGAHSSLRWSVPPWAKETYLWWLCSSLGSHPGEHVAKGVNRLRKRFFSAEPGVLSGVIFHNELCGSPTRPCPKRELFAELGQRQVPAPCVYVMPERDSGASSWNWGDERRVLFPSILLQAFGIPERNIDSFVGFIGFQRKGDGGLRTNITTRFGAGRSTTARS